MITPFVSDKAAHNMFKAPKCSFKSQIFAQVRMILNTFILLLTTVLLAFSLPLWPTVFHNSDKKKNAHYRQQFLRTLKGLYGQIYILLYSLFTAQQR